MSAKYDCLVAVEFGKHLIGIQLVTNTYEVGFDCDQTLPENEVKQFPYKYLSRLRDPLLIMVHSFSHCPSITIKHFLLFLTLSASRSSIHLILLTSPNKPPTGLI